MKKSIFILLLIVSFNSSSQENLEKSIKEFSTVKVYDLINLKMIKSDKNRVVISGKNRRDVEIINKNGKLKIRMNIEEIFDGNDTVVVLYYTTVDEVDANEGAKVDIKNTIEQYELELKVQEGAEITAEMKTTYAIFRAVTGGILNVTGSSKNQDITIFTGGIFNGKDFITSQTDVSINAAGEAYVNATEWADVNIKAGGNVYVYGNTKEINESRVLGGKVKRM